MALNPRTSPRLADRDSSRNFSALRAIIPFVLPYRLQVAGAMVALVIASGTVLALGSGLRMLVDRGFADGNGTAEGSSGGLDGELVGDATLAGSCILRPSAVGSG